MHAAWEEASDPSPMENDAECAEPHRRGANAERKSKFQCIYGSGYIASDALARVEGGSATSAV